MRTTLDLPEELVEEAQRLSHLRSKRETVIAALEELIRKAHREDLRRLSGRIDLGVDFGRSRKRRR